MELGSGIAVAGFWVALAPVAIVAIRTFNKPAGRDGANGQNGKDRSSASFPCVAHSGFEARLDGLKEGQIRQEEWMQEISADVKELLRK